ncbi:hypothetical protein QBC34DRAFT_430858 [Podospora aff. communis PSN243]|uniref:Uncharacterized protein n=1 Tax=Podospora aff. communis PSN243 TaxID=3040156 RepID=A0AAV9G5F4_9PEZI|nr:hypothetical protein QBC34DRAFT_430858 [Podospora aff. communis PSN243]
MAWHPYSVFSKAEKRPTAYQASFSGVFSGISSFIYYPTIRKLSVSITAINLTVSAYLSVARVFPSGIIADLSTPVEHGSYVGVFFGLLSRDITGSCWEWRSHKPSPIASVCLPAPEQAQRRPRSQLSHSEGQAPARLRALGDIHLLYDRVRLVVGSCAASDIAVPLVMQFLFGGSQVVAFVNLSTLLADFNMGRSSTAQRKMEAQAASESEARDLKPQTNEQIKSSAPVGNHFA